MTDWHQRYQQQAQWSQEIRDLLFSRIKNPSDAQILEVGSGTGALLEEIQSQHPFRLTGVDIDRSGLLFSQHNMSQINLVQADGYRLPYPPHLFDASICHFLLLWLQNPQAMLHEMSRVTKRAGFVIALAEPDHETRIDFPPPLDDLGNLQTKSLQKQGADTQLGRKLGFLFERAGLDVIEKGILGAHWKTDPATPQDETEWNVLHLDLKDRISQVELSRYKQIDRDALQTGSRVLFVPTFYAIGKIK